MLQILSPHPEETEVPLNLCPAEVGSPQERVTGQGIPPGPGLVRLSSLCAAAPLGLRWVGVGSGAGREIWGWARLGRRPRACRDNLFLQLSPGELRDRLG